MAAREGIEETAVTHGCCVDPAADPMVPPPAAVQRVMPESHRRYAPPQLDVARARQEALDALAALDNLSQPGSVDLSSDADYLADLHALLPDPDQFLPGRPQRLAAVWEAYFLRASGGSLSGPQKLALGVIRDGLRLDFVSPDSPGQQLAPDAAKKRQYLHQMLRQAAPERDPASFFTGTAPQQVQLPNHASAYQHADFVRAELEKCAAAGVIRPWTGPGKPRVINGLLVVVGAKLRLCLNTMYVNAFIAYVRFLYERLRDMKAYVRPGDFLYATDDKSGYWQIPMHPDMWTYLGMEWESQIWVWPFLPFGLAPACRIYTVIKQEVYRPIRERGVRMSSLIDDQSGAAESEPKAKFQCRQVVRICAALGFTLSIGKCQFLPRPTVRFLGFIVDAPAQAFRVPQEKIDALAALVQQLSVQAAVTVRELARLVGKMVAMSPAVGPAPLHSRLIARALKGHGGWDEALPDTSQALQEARRFLEVLERCNGRARWHKGPAVLIQVVGDASESAYAAFLPNGELGGQVMRIPFSPEERARMLGNRFSSTEREIRTVSHTVGWLQQLALALVQHRRLQYFTDSQASGFCILGMKGANECLLAVADVYRRCAESDTEIEVVWRPRTDVQQRYADALSKYTDPTQWLLRAEVYDWLLCRPELQGRSPAFDLFADEFSTKVAGYFFSPHWSPSTRGVDALAQSWAGLRAGGQPLLYCYPPFGLLGPVIRKIADERVDVLLIAPVWPRPWRAMLLSLPVRQRWVLAQERPCIPGPQAPGGEVRVRASLPYKLEAVYIAW
ncbi:hypothetical protein PLESTM_001928300 [Pleodorina starrii]|nr:hypothetical protein PLESTM_001928300 [Pleodorina starrii]